MDGLSFVTATPPVESDPARADIACFIGFIARRVRDPGAERTKLQDALKTLGWSGPDLPASARLVPADLVPAGNSARSFVRWLRDAQWKPGGRATRDSLLFAELLRVWLPPAIVDWWSANDYLNPASVVPAVDLLELRDVPVPVDSWDVFDALFAWDARPISDQSAGRCDTAMGAALRSFFSQGGRKCFVVRLADPWAALAPASVRHNLGAAYRSSVPRPSPVDRASWRGVGHLFALPETSFLCLPDLPDLFGVTPLGEEEKTPPLTPENFVECAAEEAPPNDRVLRGIPPPHCDAAGYVEWANLVREIGKFLEQFAREVQFIAAIPLPVDAPALSGPADLVAERIRVAVKAQWTQVASIGTAFVQLAYPWLRTLSSPNLPGGVEAPDGVLAGVLANNALTRGAWRSAIRQPVSDLTSVDPVLDRAMLARDLSPAIGSRRFPLTLRDRVSIIGPAPDGFRLLSDVTTDDDEAYRPANVNRLLNAILRAARQTGSASVFQNNGPILWNRLRESLTGLLAGLWAEGALEGESAEEAFEVRCDRSTMTQADLDAGRVICRVTFTAASPIVHITVLLAMDEGGQISLASRQAQATPQSQAA